jgi:glycine cleavage system H protein
MQTLFSEHHLWVLPQADGTMMAGISNHAQNMLGDIVFVEFPAIGSKLSTGNACGIVESVKTASDLHAPLDGEVVAINESLQDRPEQLNDAPETTWIFRFRPNDATQMEKLMTPESYQAFLEK